MIKKIIFLGSSNALKPLIILKNIMEQNLLENKEIIYLCDNNNGIVRQYCEKNNIQVVTINDVKFNDVKEIEKIKNLDIDILISIGWEYKIPDSILNLCKYTPINCHGSILPDYRGSRAYVHYWANCEEYYGATIHYINSTFDDGNTVIKGRLKMFGNENLKMIHRRTAELCSYLIPIAIHLIENGYYGERELGEKRYFFKISPMKSKLYRMYNKIAITFNMPRKITPHKYLD